MGRVTNSSNRNTFESSNEADHSPGKRSLPEITKKFAVVIFGFGLGFVLAEILFRLFDPYPYIPQWEINHTEHGNLMQFDPILGWDGVPNSAEWFITENAKVWVKHNQYGFRDIEPYERSDNKPGIVFLGDSYTWGYEVDFEEMFVNRIRREMGEYEIYNLAHRGYGTDQTLLVFQEWKENPEIDVVVLMFSGNDFSNNESDFESGKPKPKFDIVNDELVLTNVPLPELPEWNVKAPEPEGPSSVGDLVRLLVFQSHLLHDLNFRRKQLSNPIPVEQVVQRSQEIPQVDLTRRILLELKNEVEGRGAKFIVFAIPSKIQLMEFEGFVPYQEHLRLICQELGIEYVDLAPHFTRSIRRTYFREGAHWNAYGHKIAAEAITASLRSK